MTKVDISRFPYVVVSTEVSVPLHAATVWGQMRDFAWFTTLDPFHARMRIEGPPCASGSRLTIVHRFMGIQILRVGRILKWTENVGYSFSDLSVRGVKKGFPHVYQYEIEPIDQMKCRIRVTVKGRWTAVRLPQWCIRLWLRFVMTITAMRIGAEMNRYARFLRRRYAVLGALGNEGS